MGSTEEGAAVRQGLTTVAVVVVLGSIMTSIDATIVNIAIDRLAADFDTSLSTIQWVATGYLLALATVIPITGWAADRFGTKRLYMVAMAIFLIGSALSGAAWSAGTLIGFRVLQGFGGGMIMPVGMTILMHAAGPGAKARVMTIVGVPMMLGPVMGPALGGWLVDDLSWRWIFFVNLPFGLLALIAAVRWLPRDRPQPHTRLDWLGLVLLSPGLGAFVYGFSATARHGGFGSAEVIVPMVAGVALIAAFAVRALRVGHPLIDLRLLRSRAVSASTLTVFASSMAFYGTMLLYPLYFQAVRGESALEAGLLIVPLGIGGALSMPKASTLSDRFGAGFVVLAGIAASAAAGLAFTQAGADTSYWWLCGMLLVGGMGLGAAVVPAMSAAYSTLLPAQIARATTTMNIGMRTGGSIGTALLAVVLQHQLTSRLGEDAAVGGLGTAAGARATPGAADRMADAFSTTFWWAVALLAVAFAAALLLPRTPAEIPVAAVEPVAEPRSEPVATA